MAAYGKLMDWGMNVSLGAVLSGETASVVAAAKADDVLVMETTGSADKCIDGNDKAFRICFYDSYQGTAAADYLKDNALADEVGVFYQSDNDYSVGLYNAFVAECQNTGVTIKETQTFTTATSTDFSTQVNALASSGVKVVFIPIYAEEASTFLTQAKGKFADDVYFFGADGLDGILGKVSQDVTIADNVLMMTPFAADSGDPQGAGLCEGIPGRLQCHPPTSSPRMPMTRCTPSRPLWRPPTAAPPALTWPHAHHHRGGRDRHYDLECRRQHQQGRQRHPLQERRGHPVVRSGQRQ